MPTRIMSAGCLLVASDTAPVKEVLTDGQNGLLVDFFDHEQLACRVAQVLAAPERYKPLREKARLTVLERYDLKTSCLPKMLTHVKTF